MARLIYRVWPPVLVLLVAGCSGPKEPGTDDVSEAMKREVAGSAARVKVAGRTDWEVVPEREQYWVKVRLTNVGEAGRVAVRVAIKTLVPYVGIGANPTDPIYLNMGPGDTATQRFTGKLPAKLADRAIGCVVEVYPKAETEERNRVGDLAEEAVRERFGENALPGGQGR